MSRGARIAQWLDRRSWSYRGDPDSKHWFTTSFLQHEVGRTEGTQTPSTGLRHPSFSTKLVVPRGPRLQALVYDILPSARSWSYRGDPDSKHWFTTSFLQHEVGRTEGTQTPSTGLRHPSFSTKLVVPRGPRLQALVYDILLSAAAVFS